MSEDLEKEDPLFTAWQGEYKPVAVTMKISMEVSQNTENKNTL